MNPIECQLCSPTLVAEMLGRLDTKLDHLDTRLDSLDKTLVRQEASLEEHVRRTDLLEKKVEADRAAVPASVDARAKEWFLKVLAFLVVTGFAVLIEEVTRRLVKG